MAQFIKVKLDSFFSPTHNKTIPSGLEIQVETNSSKPSSYDIFKALSNLGYCNPNGPTLSPSFKIIE